MKIKYLNRADSQNAMVEWITEYPKLPNVDEDYMKVREDIQKMNQDTRELLKDIGKKDYKLDLYIGIKLYEYLWKCQGFTLRVAANDDFWRYLSLKVVPDVVAERWGEKNESHYWSRATRIWLRSIWWYIHLSWQGDLDKTKKVLEADCFTTDTILNLGERTGRKGTFIEVYRYIMYFYSTVPIDNISNYTKRSGTQQDDLFRVIMKLNTVKSMVIDPGLYLGGEKEYVKSLFKDAGVNL